jgi:hypothetical protein
VARGELALTKYHYNKGATMQPSQIAWYLPGGPTPSAFDIVLDSHFAAMPSGIESLPTRPSRRAGAGGQ